MQPPPPLSLVDHSADVHSSLFSLSRHEGQHHGANMLDMYLRESALLERVARQDAPSYPL